MQSAFVDIGLERDAFLYVSDFFEDTEEYDKIVSTVEDEVAQLQERAVAIPSPLATSTPILNPRQPEQATETAAATTILPGESISAEGQREGSRPPAPSPGPEEPYGRGPRRRDRDRRGGKKPKIPSFESKSYESRPHESRRDFGFTGLEALPGESLSKHVHREESEPATNEAETAAEKPVDDKDASLGAVAEQTIPPEPPSSTDQPEEKDDNPSSSARITDRSDTYQ
jgi:ribonuclease G